MLTREMVEAIAEVAKGGYPLIEQDGAEICLDELAADWLERRNENDRLRRELDAALDAALPEHPGDGSCEYCSVAPGSWVFLCDEHNPMVAITDAQHAELACGGDPLGRCDEKPRKARAAKMATRKPASGAECSACGGSGTVGKGFSDLGVPCSVCRGTGKPASGEFDHLAVSPDWEERKVESASAESAPVCDVYGRSGERLACYDDPDGEDTGVMPARMEPCPACTPSADTGRLAADGEAGCGDCANRFPGGPKEGLCSHHGVVVSYRHGTCDDFVWSKGIQCYRPAPSSGDQDRDTGSRTCICCKDGPSLGQHTGYCYTAKGMRDWDDPACEHFRRIEQSGGKNIVIKTGNSTCGECKEWPGGGGGDCSFMSGCWEPTTPACEMFKPRSEGKSGGEGDAESHYPGYPDDEISAMLLTAASKGRATTTDALRRDVEEHCATATDLAELTERVERLAEAVNAYGCADSEYAKRVDGLEEFNKVVASQMVRFGADLDRLRKRIAARTDGDSN